MRPKLKTDLDRRAYLRQHNMRDRARRRAVVDALKSVPCMDCGHSFDPVCMDFDHRSGEIKLFAISYALTSRSVTVEQIRSEIKKCDVVCACCHRLRTHRLRDHNATCKNAAVSMVEQQRQLDLLSAAAGSVAADEEKV